jgi:predicted transcriptional regulator
MSQAKRDSLEMMTEVLEACGKPRNIAGILKEVHISHETATNYVQRLFKIKAIRYARPKDFEEGISWRKMHWSAMYERTPQGEELLEILHKLRDQIDFYGET